MSTDTGETEQDWETLHYLLTERVKATYRQHVELITTDRTGRVDAAFVRDDAGQLVPADLMSWLETGTANARDFTLHTLGGMVRLYASHPRRDPRASVVTYEEWPAMVEVRLFE
ncbi:hypothetical protein ACFPC0_10675 [Streptomyces andamanensis]|uniref:Uncharacterized protein n=1 Tax=Streptomyces andamanensis TaxID=1565035 RepID=A0ABV8TCG1_9ACTN